MRHANKFDSLQFLISHGLQVGTVIDIGVQHETRELIDCFPNHHHVLFEPEPSYYPAIERAYAAIDHTMVPAAVCDVDGMLFFEAKSFQQDGKTHFGSVSKQSGTPIQAFRLDTWLATNPRPGPYLVKIDIDGAELAVIEGAMNALANTSCLLIEAPLHTLNARLAACERAGLVLWDIIDLCYYYGNLSQVDLVFLGQSQLSNPEFRPWKTKPFDWSMWQTP